MPRQTGESLTHRKISQPPMEANQREYPFFLRVHLCLFTVDTPGIKSVLTQGAFPGIFPALHEKEAKCPEFAVLQERSRPGAT